MPRMRAACVHRCVHGVPATTDNTAESFIARQGMGGKGVPGRVGAEPVKSGETVGAR